MHGGPYMVVLGLLAKEAEREMGTRILILL